MHGPQLVFALDAMVVLVASLLAIANLVRLPGNRNAALVAGMLLGQVCMVVLGRHQYGFWIPQPLRIEVGALEPLLNLGRNLSPGLFMLLCHDLFVENRRLPRWLLALFATQLLLEEPLHLLLGPGGPASRWLTEAAPGLLQVLFAGCALYWTLAGWRADLVATRRRMRVVLMLVIGGGFLGAVLLQRMLIPWEAVENYYAHVAFTGLSGVVLAAVVIGLLGVHSIERYLDPDGIVQPQTADPPEPADTATAETAALLRLMTEERAYREPSLSIAELAGRLGLPEYRLRRLIHEGLGFRNFNAFLHDYRIREACELLRDPDHARSPILTIALSVGYQSINTFNRGFRQVMAVTPSEYRAGTAGTAPADPPTAPQILKDRPIS